MSRTGKALLFIVLSWIVWGGTALYVAYNRPPPATEIVTLPPTTQVDYRCVVVRPKTSGPKENIA